MVAVHEAPASPSSTSQASLRCSAFAIKPGTELKSGEPRTGNRRRKAINPQTSNGHRHFRTRVRNEKGVSTSSARPFRRTRYFVLLRSNTRSSFSIRNSTEPFSTKSSAPSSSESLPSESFTPSPGPDHDRNVGGALVRFQLGEHVATVRVGELNIQYDHVRLASGGEFERCATADRANDAVSMLRRDATDTACTASSSSAKRMLLSPLGMVFPVISLARLSPRSEANATEAKPHAIDRRLAASAHSGFRNEQSFRRGASSVTD